MKIYCLGPVAPRFTSIANATNATPIVVTTSAPHGLFATDVITIGGVTGNTNANGTYAPGTVVLGASTITLTGIPGNGGFGGPAFASAPQQLITSPKFPVIPGVSDNTKILVARLLFTPVPFGTATLLVGTAGLNQATFANVFRPINPPPTLGIYDYYDLAANSDLIPIAEYWVDALKPSTEAVLTSFWIK
jgi:hypothetical protein